MKGIIDRFEENFAIVELEDKRRGCYKHRERYYKFK